MTKEEDKIFIEQLRKGNVVYIYDDFEEIGIKFVPTDKAASPYIQLSDTYSHLHKTT